MKFIKCNNAKWYRIHLKGTMRKRSPQEQHQASSNPQTNKFHHPDGRHTQFAPHTPNSNPCRPANSAFAPTHHNTTCSFNAHNSTHTLLILTPFRITHSSLLALFELRVSLTQTPCNSHHQDTISVGSALSSNHPHTPHYQQNDQPIA